MYVCVCVCVFKKRITVNAHTQLKGVMEATPLSLSGSGSTLIFYGSFLTIFVDRLLLYSSLWFIMCLFFFSSFSFCSCCIIDSVLGISAYASAWFWYRGGTCAWIGPDSIFLYCKLTVLTVICLLQSSYTLSYCLDPEVVISYHLFLNSVKQRKFTNWRF